MTGHPTELDFPALLEEEAFVRRLARGLLFDEHRVDDVVQQTWLAAIRNPPHESGARRGWLRSVVRGVAANQVRADARRREHETTVAAEAASVPSVDEVLEREEQRKHVLEALRTLSEPYRTTILLRYFDGRTPKQIAAMQGVPAATVRTRLKRGTERMRDHLDRAYGGDRRSWCLALVPLATPRASAPGLALVAKLGVLWNWGKTPAIALAAALLLLVGGLLVFDPAGSVESVRPEEVGSNPVVYSTGVVSTDGGERVEVDGEPRWPRVHHAPDYAAVLSGFRGRLVDVDGGPVAGGSVSIAGIEGLSLYSDAAGLFGEDANGPEVFAGHATSRADGTFSIAGAWPRAKYALRANSAAGARFLPLARTPASGEVIDLGDVVLDATAAIEGVVVDADGEPVEGALVWAADVPALLIAAGSLDRAHAEHGAILAVPELTDDELRGEPGYASRFMRHLRDGVINRLRGGLEERTRSLVIERMPWLEAMFEHLPLARTRTGVDGAFRLEGLVEAPMTVVVRAPGHNSLVRSNVRTKTGVTKSLRRLRLGEGEWVEGIVVDADGRPVAGAEVRVAATGLLGFTGIAFCEPGIRTDDRGGFAVNGMPRGAFVAAARRSPAESWVCAEPAEVHVRIELPRRHTLELVIADGDVNAEDVELRLVAGPPLGELSRIGVQTPLEIDELLSFRGGSAIVRDLPAGLYTAQLRMRDRATALRVIRVPTTGPVNLSPLPCAPFDVMVTSASGEAVRDAKVYAQSAERPAWAASVLPRNIGLARWGELPVFAGYTDRDGRLRVEGLSAGAVDVSVFHPRYGQVAERVEDLATPVELELAGTGAVAGRLLVRDAPASAARWRVAAIPLASRFSTGMPRVSGQATVDAGGAFRIDGLAPGRWKVQARASLEDTRSMRSVVTLVDDETSAWFIDANGGHSVEVDIRAGATTEVEFEADPANLDVEGARGSIVGTIRIDGRVEHGVIVQDLSGWGSRVIEKLDRDGGFAMRGVAVGQRRIHVVHAVSEQTLWAGELEVKEAEETRLDLELRTGTLRGRVLLPDGRPAAGVKLGFTAHLFGGIALLSTNCDHDGEFVCRSMPVGDYRIRAKSHDYRCDLAAEVSIGDRNPRIDIQLGNILSLTGRVVGCDAKGVRLVSSRGTHFVWTGSDGRFRFERVEPGRYRLQIRLQDGREVHAVPGEFELDLQSVQCEVRAGGEVAR